MYSTRKRHRNFKRIRATVENGAQATGSNPSKRHRERLNSELEALALLLPFENSIIGRLDKLSILRLAVCFLQAKNVFQHITKEHLEYFYYPEFPFLRDKRFENKDTLMTALSGFLIMLNMNGEMLYVSENVSSYLGFHQCDVLHQSVFDVVHSEDIESIRKVLQPSTSCSRSVDVNRQTAVRFRCFMDNTCGFLRFDVRGKLIKLEGCQQMFPSMCQIASSPSASRVGTSVTVPYGFLAACVPVVVPSHVDLSIEESFLKSKHSLQLVICSGDDGFVTLLGLKDSLLPVSFYSFIHEHDLPFIADAHRQVLASGNSGVLIYRLRSRNSNLTYWLQTSCRLTARNGKPEFITCTHRLLTEFEGAMLLDMRDATELKCRNSLENRNYSEGAQTIAAEPIFSGFSLSAEPSPTLLPIGPRVKGAWRMSALDGYSYLPQGKDETSLSQQASGYGRSSCEFPGTPVDKFNGYGNAAADGSTIMHRTAVRASQYPSCSTSSPWYCAPNLTNLQQTILLSERQQQYYHQYHQSNVKDSITYIKSNCFMPALPSTPAIATPLNQNAQPTGTKVFSITQVTNTLLCQ